MACSSLSMIPLVVVNFPVLELILFSLIVLRRLFGVSHIGISDHSLVYIFRKIFVDLPSSHKTITYRKFKNFCSASFRHDISHQSWPNLHDCDCPNAMWDVGRTYF